MSSLSEDNNKKNNQNSANKDQIPKENHKSTEPIALDGKDENDVWIPESEILGTAAQ